MPDLCRFKKINGRLYCWDRDAKSFYRVGLTEVAGKAELALVTAAYMDEDGPQREGEGETEL